MFGEEAMIDELIYHFCPVCRECDDYVVFDGGFLSVCTKHRLRWSVLSNEPDMRLKPEDEERYRYYLREFRSVDRDDNSSDGATNADTGADFCPLCGGESGCFDCGGGPWLVCSDHRLKWRPSQSFDAGRLPEPLHDPAIEAFLDSHLRVDPARLVVHPPPLPLGLRMAIRAVIAYLWRDEGNHFDADLPATSGHIFPVLCWVRWWLEGLPWTDVIGEGGDEA